MTAAFTAGYEAGKSEGYNDGHEKGLQEGERRGFEAGKEAAADKFFELWDLSVEADEDLTCKEVEAAIRKLRKE